MKPSDGVVFNHRHMAALAVAETLVWAGLYYAFPALIAHWESDLGWAKTEIAGAFTVALVLSALTAPVAGRLIDRGFGRAVLLIGAVSGGLLIGTLAWSESRVGFYVIWALIGCSLAGCLYEPCFAYLTRLLRDGARSVITRITLVAGFAGTVSFPMANLLAQAYDWRTAVLAFSAVILIVAVPLFVYGTSAGAGTHRAEGEQVRDKLAVRRTLRRPTFWLLAFTFSMVGLTHGIIITHLLPMLAEWGVPLAVAVLAASMIGPMQVAGRVGMMLVEKRWSMQTICTISFLFMAGAIISLMGAAALPALLVVFVVLQGSGYGATSITRPVVTAEILGRDGFGAISGTLALGFMAASAAAPTLAAAVWTIGGYDLVRLLVLVCVVLGAAAFVTATRLART